MTALPIDQYLPDIVETLLRRGSLVLQAAPGAGKTTRVPPALLASSQLGSGEIIVLEPRRLAARLAARRIASELGEPVGETVGYTVRFEDIGGPRTKIRFLTEGIMARRLQSDPRLEGVSAVILDEFHERHLQTDLVLALLYRLQRTERSDLRILVMSATLEGASVAQYLGLESPLEVAGRQYEVRIDHLPRPDQRPLAEQVKTALASLLDEGLSGDVLVFLPGALEIRRAAEACAGLAAAHNLLIVPLHGDLSMEAQDLAVRPALQRKVVLSTNIAESSVTIDGVVAVIDSGLAKESSHSPWSGVPTLEVVRTSQAAAIQRAGRAGRTTPGVCRRLFTLPDLLARPAYRTPEIVREDLAETVLSLLAAGVRDLVGFEWFEPPPTASLEAALTLLRLLGAIDPAGRLTEIGREMLRYPLHPRQARILVEARRRGVYSTACTVVALIGERDIIRKQSFDAREGRSGEMVADGCSDLLDRVELFNEAVQAGPKRDPRLDAGAIKTIDQVRRQLLRTASNRGRAPAAESEEQPLLASILTGYPDRVARRRDLKDSTGDLILSSGSGAILAPASVVRSAEYLVAVEAVERRDRTGSARYQVSLASAIEPDWLIDLPGEALQERVEARWNGRLERVEVVERLIYDQLVIDEHPASNSGHAEAQQLLASQAVAAGWERFVPDPEQVWRLLWRVAFVGWNFPELEMTDIGESDIVVALAELSVGKRSFAELRAAGARGRLADLLRGRIPNAKLNLLNRLAPETVNIAGRKNVRINYERNQSPWIASRLQDFIGMREPPRIGDGRVPLVLHLLAPNNRPVQVTTDLSGFWERTYPQLRRELSRRYPRHNWPE